MVTQRFQLEARVSTDEPEAVAPVVRELFATGSVERVGDEFVVRGESAAEDVKEANRALLSALRRAEKRTRLRARWTAEDGTEYRFFDYVLKKTTPA